MGISKWLRVYAIEVAPADGTNFKVAASRHVEWQADEAQTTFLTKRAGRSKFFLAADLCGCAATGSRAPTSRVC